MPLIDEYSGVTGTDIDRYDEMALNIIKKIGDEAVVYLSSILYNPGGKLEHKQKLFISRLLKSLGKTAEDIVEKNYKSTDPKIRKQAVYDLYGFAKNGSETALINLITALGDTDADIVETTACLLVDEFNIDYLYPSLRAFKKFNGDISPINVYIIRQMEDGNTIAKNTTIRAINSDNLELKINTILSLLVWAENLDQRIIEDIDRILLIEIRDNPKNKKLLTAVGMQLGNNDSRLINNLANEGKLIDTFIEIFDSNEKENIEYIATILGKLYRSNRIKISQKNAIKSRENTYITSTTKTVESEIPAVDPFLDPHGQYDSITERYEYEETQEYYLRDYLEEKKY